MQLPIDQLQPSRALGVLYRHDRRDQRGIEADCNQRGGKSLIVQNTALIFTDSRAREITLTLQLSFTLSGGSLASLGECRASLRRGDLELRLPRLDARALESIETFVRGDETLRDLWNKIRLGFLC